MIVTRRLFSFFLAVVLSALACNADISADTRVRFPIERVSFNPALIPNLVAWFETSKGGMFQSNTGITPAVINGDSVGYLPDWSGRNFIVTSLANDTTRPVLGGVGVNPFITFNKASSQILVRASALGSYAAGGSSWFVCIASSAGVSNNYLGGEGDSGSGNSIYALFNMLNATDTSALIRNNANVTLFANGTTVATNVFPTPSTIVVYGVIDNGSSLTPWVNGVAGAASSYTRSGTLTQNRFGLGGLYRTTPSLYMSMDFYGAAIYNRAITATEAANLSAYKCGMH